MQAYHEEERINTTVGDLIAAVSDAAFEFCNDKRVAYLLAGLTLKVILKKAPSRGTDGADLLSQRFPESTTLH